MATRKGLTVGEIFGLGLWFSALMAPGCIVGTAVGSPFLAALITVVTVSAVSKLLEGANGAQ